MTRDRRRSAVALTAQGGGVPPQLVAAARGQGGHVHDLRRLHPSLLQRAHALRALMDEADLVVYHVHPWDSVAVAAANLPGTRPPIVFENHADHTFWLGLSAADVVMDHRTVARTLSHDLRGVRHERLGSLPLPIDPAPPPTERAELRRAMHIDPQDVLAISVANPAKMRPVWGESFASLLDRGLADNPRLVVLLVGPGPDEDWNTARRRFPRRIFHMGVLDDVERLLAAADLYLDSYPVSSGTSILEAAAHGLPLLSLQAYDGPFQIFHANSPGLDGSRHATATREEYLRTLRALVSRPELRRSRGTAARAHVLGVHHGDNWSVALEKLYQQVRSVPLASVEEYPAAIDDADYGAALVRFTYGRDGRVDLRTVCAPVADAADPDVVEQLLLSAAIRDGSREAVRVRSGWEHHPEWTGRLTRLASRSERLVVSMPLSGDDDGTGERSALALTRILAANGLDPSTCGDLTLEAGDAASFMPASPTELDFTAEALDRLEARITGTDLTRGGAA